MAHAGHAAQLVGLTGTDMGTGHRESQGRKKLQANEKKWFEASHVLIHFGACAAATLKLAKLGMNY